MSWLAHRSPGSGGLLVGTSHGQSKTAPAVAAYRGRLWCLWADFEGKLWYAVTIKEGEFGERTEFPQNGLPVMTNLNGHLHAVIALDSGEMVHYLYDDEDEQTWTCLGLLDTAAGMVTHSSPCLVAFHNKLFLAFIRDQHLYFAVWTNSTAHPTSASNPSGTWSEAFPVTQGQTFTGIPALFVLDGALHLLCATETESREIFGYRYDYREATWSQCDDVTEGRAARGISATSYGDSAYLGFIEDGPGGQHNAVYVASYNNGLWQPHEAVDGQSAADPPQIAILNGRIHCIFNDNTAKKDLRWYSRPVLRYSLSSWMETIPDERLLSELTIPGTHDSCARSNIPFVRTQYLSITQQLHLGIRFLDLRLRRHGDGTLHCYHGGIPIDLPAGLSFESVMEEVWALLRGPGGDGKATETVLISINNDDTSPPQQANPEIFYEAVDDAIANTPPYPDGTHRWFAEPVTPTLGDVRGRAVLLRRFRGDPAMAPQACKGLDLSAWLDDNPYFVIVTPTNVRVHLQDKWKYADRISLADLIASKSGFVHEMMRRAAGGAITIADSNVETGGGGDAEEGKDDEVIKTEEEWYVNFCSAVGDPVEHGEIAEAKWIAVGAHSDWMGHWVDGMNVRTRDFLAQQRSTVRKRLGIVNLDYPELPEDNDAVARLIETNF